MIPVRPNSHASLASLQESLEKPGAETGAALGRIHHELGFSRRIDGCGVSVRGSVQLEQLLLAGTQLRERAVRERRLTVGIPCPLDESGEGLRN